MVFPHNHLCELFGLGWRICLFVRLWVFWCIFFFCCWGGRFLSAYRTVNYRTVNLTYVDAVKRRTLPAWIREGLEKMEREKQKKLEKERMEQQRSQMSKKEKKENDEAEEGDGPRLPQKSKFVSRKVWFLSGLYLLKVLTF